MFMSVCFVSFVFLFLLGLLCCFCGVYFIMGDLVYFIDWNIITLNGSSVIMTFLFDWMSLLFMGFVFIISSLVILYSDDYMAGDLNIVRFILLVLMFVVSMMFLIISPNVISILLGWDGLGLVSYLLVIYYQNVKSYGAGMLTVLSNRIGDVALLMVIAWMINFGSWSFIYYLEFLSGSIEMELISFLVVLAAMTKSAQIPFSSWLPAAMAAPTPVSALVHSSTLVTAGVYLLIRFSPSFSYWLNVVLLLVSGLTMFMAGLGANFEFDLSKIIALSTLSQLGLMIMTISIGLSGLAFFHLLTHALFKALLFMCAGGVIHSMGDSQDIRFMGGLSVYMPFTSSSLMVSNFALCGMPFLAGFYSSDFILEMFSMSYINMFGFLLLFVSTGLTVCYSFRLFYFVLCGDFNFVPSYSMVESNYNMVFGMIGLLVMSIFGGGSLMWLICPTPSMICLPYYLKFLTLFVVFIGAWLGYEIAGFVLGDSLFSVRLYGPSSFAGSMWFMPFFSTYGVSFGPLGLGYSATSVFDSGWMEYFGGQGMYWVLFNAGSVNQWFQYNNLSVFLGFFVMWIVILLFVLIY
uniref:NADH-ubiquinone oxidoreductase chain 5 n=1 Tax=Microcerotermes sp. 2 MLW-2023a TaxID=3077004 RepID=A0AA97ITZ6_9NEOP|nr:NADH dehydrogenase subunit 5 [Microcerotermes sp. 2 MLW-2023a]WNL54115.1 NADH dehydrogenase subunit 5 [Microcerotermes sp. 2 MLW-2023a]WNL54297.1 NADH dehydrogenase subunit 5 [Microcerotermes sp. 2 MLW-2023a]